MVKIYTKFKVTNETFFMINGMYRRANVDFELAKVEIWCMI